MSWTIYYSNQGTVWRIAKVTYNSRYHATKSHSKTICRGLYIIVTMGPTDGSPKWLIIVANTRLKIILEVFYLWHIYILLPYRDILRPEGPKYIPINWKGINILKIKYRTHLLLIDTHNNSFSGVPQGIFSAPGMPHGVPMKIFCTPGTH